MYKRDISYMINMMYVRFRRREEMWHRGRRGYTKDGMTAEGSRGDWVVVVAGIVKVGVGVLEVRV